MNYFSFTAAKYIRQDLDKSFVSNVDCHFVQFNNETEVFNEFSQNISKLIKIKTHCFCNEMLYNTTYCYTENYQINNTMICKDWLNGYIKYNGLTVGVVILIPIVNQILTWLINCKYISKVGLSKFEKNKKLSIEKQSNISKIFRFQLLNTVN